MLEIEMKFPVADFQPVIFILEEWHAERGESETEEDHYYGPPDRDFAKTDEALRLRQIGEKNLATYKGPKEAGPTKTRREVEAPLADGPVAAAKFREFLECLRYQNVATVRKRRQFYRFQRDGFLMHACLDDVENVGRFIELEITTSPDAKAKAQEVLQKAATELKLKDSERRSYLEMLLTKLAPVPPM